MKIGNLEISDWMTDNPACIFKDECTRDAYIDDLNAVIIFILRDDDTAPFNIFINYDLEAYSDLFKNLGSFTNINDAKFAADNLLLKLSKIQAFL